MDPEDAAGYGIGLVPMTVEAGGRTLTDAEATELLKDRPREPIRTAAPSPGQFLAAINDRPAPAGVLIVTVAARLSASHRAASLAARLAADAGGPATQVVDSGSAAGGQALVALAAARAAAAGLALPAVAAAAARSVPGVRLIGLIGSLDALVRGGRLPAAAASAGRLTGAQPLFELRGGRIRPLRPAFSREAAMNRLVSAFRRDRKPAAEAEIAVSHALAATAADDLLGRLTGDASPALVIVGGLGSAMLAHAGAGTLGLSWRWRDSG